MPAFKSKGSYIVFSFPFRRGKAPLAEFDSLAAAKGFAQSLSSHKLRWKKEEAKYQDRPWTTSYYSDDYYIGVNTGEDPAQLDREIKKIVENERIADFDVRVGGLEYRVIIRPDSHRGGYGAALVSNGVGIIMDENGISPSDALTRLARSLEVGDGTDRKIADEIYKHSSRLSPR
jgi:hypothetical protein